MDSTTLAYISGFLDGDGSIFFQLVKREDYVFGYQIRSSIAFYQRTDKQEILEWLKENLQSGYIRHRKTGVSDYTIVEPKDVYRILMALKPYAILKSEHIQIGLSILEKLPKVVDGISFLNICQLVDRFQEINYSKKRTVTSRNVELYLKTHNLLTPVETDP